MYLNAIFKSSMQEKFYSGDGVELTFPSPKMLDYDTLLYVTSNRVEDNGMKVVSECRSLPRGCGKDTSLSEFALQGRRTHCLPKYKACVSAQFSLLRYSWENPVKYFMRLKRDVNCAS